LTIKTVWAWFSIDMIKEGLLTKNGVDIIDFDWDYGFWYDKYNDWYSWSLTSIWNWINIENKDKDINSDWEKNTYVYKVKFWAKIDTMQWAGVYINKPIIKVVPKY
jgi:hypothetical protein